MNYLGLDYGDKHIGVAIATSPLADPLATYDTKDILRKMPELIKNHDIHKIIIGNCPEDFLNKIKELGREVILVDETLTTVDATKALFHTTKSRRKAQIHAVSAAIILQSYLDLGVEKP